MNDPKIISYILREFIPVNGAVELLQPSRYGAHESPASQWFEERAKNAIKTQQPNFWEQFKTTQGFYVMSADGQVFMYKIGLAYEADDFLRELDRAVQEFHRSAPAAVRITQDEIARSGPLQPEAGTSVVRIYSRIAPIGQNSSLSERSIGRDHMWIFADEVKQIISDAHSPNVNVEMPRSLTARMVRFQLLNHVGNIMQPWDEKHVKTADFKVRLLSNSGNIRKYAFTGRFVSQCNRFAEHGAGMMDGTISGNMEIDASTAKISRFRAYGEAESQGRNDSLSRDRKYPVAFAMVEANDRVAQTTPPIWYGISPIFRQIYRQPTLAFWK
ncbi:MAG TPA: hypothetical protein V6D17_12720 [Candidatus Obscuribacterales bacterium]